MTGLVRKATLLSLCGLLVAGVAMAGTRSASTSTKPACVRLVGDNGTTVDPTGAFTIVVRDLANNTVANSNVVLDFSACTESHIGDQTAQKFAGMTVTTLGKKVSAITNSVGVASFNIEGAIDGTGTGPVPAAAGCATVSADNVPLGTITVVAINSDVKVGVAGSNAVNAADISAMIQRQLPAIQPYKASSDLNCDGAMNPADVSVLISYFLPPSPVGGYSTVCPGTQIGAGGYAW